ncbi:MAG: hypothetical protein H0X66_18650 [Verrucomicrobia bacterium]|nr:hypothetical protein [Verrucomicrobiota bacterium]
MKRLNNERFEV